MQSNNGRPTYPLKGALSWLGQEHGTAGYAVCPVESVDGLLILDKLLLMVRPTPVQWALSLLEAGSSCK